MPTKLTPHFSLEELIRSETAARLNLNNQPSEKVVANLKWLAVKILEPIRSKVGPLVVTSGYRSVAVNASIGGSETSQHCEGKAADIVLPGKSAEALFKTIIKNTKVPFDQLILEFASAPSGGWVHVSYDRDKAKQRGSILEATNVGGVVEYKVVPVIGGP